MLSFEPCPMLIMMITAATPMMIPSIERNERILLFATARRLTFNRFSIFIFPNRLAVLAAGPRTRLPT